MNLNHSLERFCTESPTGKSPLFFLGSSPSMAARIINPSNPAHGVMISVNALRKRKTDFNVNSWLLDSGAFTEISQHGKYRYSVKEYYDQISRWAKCGNLLAAISQDYMCESFILERTGGTIEEHQKLSIERYDQLLSLNPSTLIIPVLQGYQISDYLSHVYQYGERLKQNQWVGVGSICKRNGNPEVIKDILKSIKCIRPDLRLHGFGLKLLALEHKEIRDLLYSSDSMAWSYPKRFNPELSELELGHEYQEKIISASFNEKPHKLPTCTSGAGNGQGRKPKWKAGKTKSIRVPERFADRLLSLAKEWDAL